MFNDLLPIAEHEFSDHHAPLYIEPKGAWLRKECPQALSIVSGKAHDKAIDYLPIILKVSNATAQYALLLHYHRIAGTIPKSSRRPATAIKQEIEAYNLFQSGLNIPEIARRLNLNACTAWRLLTKGQTKRKYHHLNRYEKQEINTLRSLKTPFKEIARLLNIPARTVRGYLWG